MVLKLLMLIGRVLALGEMFDLTKPAIPIGGKRFYYLARAALATEPIFSQPTLTTIQTIVRHCLEYVLEISISPPADTDDILPIALG